MYKANYFFILKTSPSAILRRYNNNYTIFTIRKWHQKLNIVTISYVSGIPNCGKVVTGNWSSFENFGYAHNITFSNNIHLLRQLYNSNKTFQIQFRFIKIH